MRLGIPLLALLALAGCEQGTEVGNPEVVQVTARFLSYDTSGSVQLESLPFRVVRMDYDFTPAGAKPQTGTCWNKPGGTLVNIASNEPSALPDTSVRDGEWTRSEMVLAAPDDPPGLPDSSDLKTWSNPRYAKFNWVRNTDTLPALFEMPQGMQIGLIFDAESMAEWRWDGSIWVLIQFDAGKWAAPLSRSGPWKTRVDGKHRRYVLFSPSENPADWNALKQNLAASFYSDSTQVR